MTAVDARPTLITEPGVYALTDAQYHADPVAGGSLSSSGARALIAGPPARFHHDRLHGRPDRDVFDLGRAAHSLVLGVGDPIAALDFTDRRTKAYKDAAAEARAAGMTPLLAADAARVEAMAAALRAHPVAGPLFGRPGAAEQNLVWRDDESGVWCRARIDWLPDVAAGRVLVVDYKTGADAAPHAFAKSMATYGYHQQGPFYSDGVTALGLGQDPAFVLVAQEKEPPYLVSVGQPSERAIEWGRVLNRKARDIYRHCTETGDWPGYGDGIAELDLPGWQVNQYEAAHAAGAYDTLTDSTGDLT